MGGSLTERPKKHASVVTEPVSQGENAIQVSEASSSSNRAGTTGVGEAEEVLDTVSSSKTNLSRVFTLGVETKRQEISIFAFEVANIIVLGADLMQSLSEENIRHLKEVVLPSERVQSLISRDMDELLIIAAADKREDFNVFSRGVVRFGNYSKDSQWQNLDRYFEKLFRLESKYIPQENSEMEMQQLITLVLYTVELYHELHALEKLDEDYLLKLQEPNNLNSTQRVLSNCLGDNLAILREELKSQKKLVKKLKKKSLWSKNLEEVMEKLVDVVIFLHLRMLETFGSADAVAQERMRRCEEIRLNTWEDRDWQVQDSQGNHKELGSAGLALHYANIIAQIDLRYKSSCVPPETRDPLYQGLPRSIKSRLRKNLQSFELKEELTVPQIKAEIEKTLQWLVPMATNTRKAHNSFGWVGELVTTGCEANRKATGRTVLLRVETLHHADKEKTEAYILELLVWLHHLDRRQARTVNSGITCPPRSPVPLESYSFRALDVIDGLDNFQTS